ncbi:MAG: type II toxin-antitoxin system VapC family toxin [Propionibacteriaceae bacterium]|jgi:predicted nucleic acid-binding protein|nr:type II toxin-antitoxin system VapC family toxin [Propionibacteriaceae bacterium]
MKYLIDTNVVSEPTARYPNLGALRWMAELGVDNCAISAITLGEILIGIMALRRRGSSKRLTQLTKWAGDVEKAYQGRIIPIDAQVARTWGNLYVGRTLPLNDSLVAATALTHNLTLVTRNVKDFLDIPITIINPFDAGNDDKTR